MTVTSPVPQTPPLLLHDSPSADPRAATFAAEGFLGPIPLLTRAECRWIARYLQRPEHPAPLDWDKGRAVHERLFHDLATKPALLSLVTSILGEDVLLWGASAVTKAPGHPHPWHSDIESSHPAGRFVSVWIGIENTSHESALQVISRSHRLGRTVQEARFERGVRRALATPQLMLDAAREGEPEAALVQPVMTDGDAIVFDGRLWHGSNNTRKRGSRTALLLQYVAADCPVRIPDLSQLDWPFRLRETPRPATILVSGSDRSGVNRLVPAPPPSSRGLPMVVTAVHPFVLPLDHPAKEWERFPAFRGPTRSLADMACHASVLSAGHMPHPPHAHVEEELLIPLHGEVELLITDSPTDPAPRLERLRPGSLVYYPAWQHHTIRNPGTSPVAYLMFKWHAASSGAKTPLTVAVHHFGSAAAPAGAPPFWMHRIFEGPTAWLGRLHSHLTVMQPGGGYDEHVDAYDVAIVVLSGQVETLGQVVEPLSVIYYAAGEPHGMRNVGTEPARYLVFEFHAPGSASLPQPVGVARKAFRLAKRIARGVRNRLR